MKKLLMFLFLCVLLDERAAVGAVLGAASNAAGATKGTSWDVMGNIGNTKVAASNKKKALFNALDYSGALSNTVSNFGGKSLLGGDEDEVIEPFPGYFALGSTLTDKVQSEINSSGQMAPFSFYTDQPQVESAAEQTILGKLTNPTSASAYSSDITDNLYAARKANLKNTFDEERAATNDMYNRLGLSSSTPGLQAQQDLYRDEAMQLDEINAQLMYEDIARGLKAQELSDAQTSNYTDKALSLGSVLRSADQTALQATYDDWLRAYNEPYQWASLGSGILGTGEGIYLDSENNGAQTSAAAINLVSQLLKNKAASSGSSGSASGTSPYYSTSGSILGSSGSSGSLGNAAANYYTYGY